MSMQLADEAAEHDGDEREDDVAGGARVVEPDDEHHQTDAGQQRGAHPLGQAPAEEQARRRCRPARSRR